MLEVADVLIVFRHSCDKPFKLLIQYALIVYHAYFSRNCLFRALSDQLFGHPEKHKQLRKEVVTYMRNHKEDFEPFHSDENGPFDHHLDLLERDGTYAGNDGLVAFARANNITIAIHQLNEPLWQINGSTNGEILEPEICFIEALAIIQKGGQISKHFS